MYYVTVVMTTRLITMTTSRYNNVRHSVCRSPIVDDDIDATFPCRLQTAQAILSVY